MEAGWSAKRVARHLGRSDCVVRRCWDQWIREMSFTRGPGSGRPRQTTRREVHRYERNWTAAEWNQVVFSDESRLNLIRDDNRVRVWRLRGGRLNPVFALQRHIAPTAGVMGPFFNNARPHTARVSQDCLRTVTTLHWPARSPDLSPIEHIWAHLGWRVGHPTSLNELEARLQQIWKEMSQDIIQSLYASMPDRIASCIRARGGATGWQDQPNTTGCPIGHSLSYSIEKLKSPFLCKL
ncbi:transposable element Tcb2 transposase [Trichonephila clavipes]|nr:transposable element Tcb2 transposase [Trichonephila clavipes]